MEKGYERKIRSVDTVDGKDRKRHQRRKKIQDEIDQKKAHEQSVRDLCHQEELCMFTDPPLQPLLWDIMVRACMSTNLLLGDTEKAFLQISVKEEDRVSK